MRRLTLAALATGLGIFSACRGKESPVAPSAPFVLAPIPVTVGGVPAATMPTPVPTPVASASPSPVQGNPTPSPNPTPNPTPRPPPGSASVVSARISGPSALKPGNTGTINCTPVDSAGNKLSVAPTTFYVGAKLGGKIGKTHFSVQYNGNTAKLTLASNCPSGTFASYCEYGANTDSQHVTTADLHITVP